MTDHMASGHMDDTSAGWKADASSNRVCGDRSGPYTCEKPAGHDGKHKSFSAVVWDASSNSAAVIAKSLQADSYYGGGNDDALLLADSIIAALGRATRNRVQAQDSLTDQVMRVWKLALEHGEHDAADWIRRTFEPTANEWRGGFK